jgi:ethanolamine utilization protein EutQ (cupin superfamily)
MKRPTPLPASAVAAVAAVATLLLASCTSGPAADVSSLDANVTLAVSSGDENTITESTEAHLGDTVSTDEAGRAQLDYPDGSLTRIGPSTRFTVVELPDGDTATTVTELDVGETWHRVEELTGDDASYEVETPVGTAAVRGTAFSLTCTVDEVCTLIVIEGTVEFEIDGEVIVVEAFQRLVVPDPAGGTPVPTAFPTDAMAEDDWLVENAETDGPFDDQDAVEAAGVSGEWSFVRTLISEEHPNLVTGSPGDVENFTWTIEQPDCSGPCSWHVVSTSGNEFDYVLENGVLTRSESDLVDCVDEVTGELLHADTGTIVYTSTLVIGETTDDGPIGSTATTITGSPDAVLTMTTDCGEQLAGSTYTALYEMELTRTP